MPRPLAEIIAHIRMVSENPNVSTTLIQTEDLLLLCDAAEKAAGVEKYYLDEIKKCLRQGDPLDRAQLGEY